MPLAFLLDEHFRGPIWRAVLRHNAIGENQLDVVRIGDAPAPPLGTFDSEILRWAEQEARILVTMDRHTMPRVLRSHRESSGHCPGIVFIRPSAKLRVVIESLELIAYLGRPEEFADAVSYYP